MTCLYASLCLYLHNTKRIKPLTLRAFLENNTYDEHLKKCFEIVNNEKGKTFEGDEARKYIKGAEDRLRQTRHRILSERENYNDNKAWSAIRKDKEFEWGLYCILDDNKTDEVIHETYKRWGNLNNDINNLLELDCKTVMPKQITEAFNKYHSKLKKIGYDNYVKTLSFILNRLCKNKQNYGSNIYRLEKESRYAEITDTVNKLLECKSEKDEQEILDRNFLLRDIWFPKLRKDCNIMPLDYLKDYAKDFIKLLNLITLNESSLIA